MGQNDVEPTPAELRRTAATHSWAGAAVIPLTPAQAKTGDMRAMIILPAQTKLTIVDSYCTGCRMTYEACAHKVCTAASTQTNEHLRGGPIGSRRRSMVRDPLADAEAS